MSTEHIIHSPRTASVPVRRRRPLVAASITALAAATMLAVTVPASGADAQAREAPPSVGPRLQAILDRAVKSQDTSFPGVALYVRRPGRVTWSGAAGKARLDPARRMREGDGFRAGSITKPFVAAATLQLAEAGRFSLDDPLPAVLPARVIARFPQADLITVRMLLNHTSGLGEYSDARHEREVFADPGRRWTVSEFLDRAASRPPFSAPGERHAYSNTNYTLLGLILEHATGKSWRAVVRERVIERLHLRHTSLPRPAARPRGHHIAHGYQLVNGRVLDLTDVDSSMAGAAGGNSLLTTAKDLARFNRALLAGRLFQREATRDEMRTFVAAEDANGRVGYGLGVERYVLPGGVEMIGHVGEAAGYWALTLHLPAQHIDIALALNMPDDPMPVLIPALKVLLAGAS